jgi:hypothetical protein
MPDTTGTRDCSVTAKFGHACPNPSLPDAPFPICLKHASRVLRYLNSFLTEEDGPALTAARDMEQEAPHIPPILPEDGVSIVYYLRVGKYIKIGQTINPGQRIRVYPPDSELLAYELGDRTLEKLRIKQFRRSLRSGFEWFAPTDDLLKHIDHIRATQQVAA